MNCARDTMVQTKTLAWLMTIALASVTLVFVAQVLEPAEFQKMFQDSSLFVSRSILISCFFIFLYYTSKVLYGFFTYKKTKENTVAGMLLLLLLFTFLTSDILQSLLNSDFFYCYNFEFGNCMESILYPLLGLFTLSLLLLSSFFYLGILQTNKEVTLTLPTKQHLAKIQITLGCFLFIGTFIWTIWGFPQFLYTANDSYMNNINQAREWLLEENPHADDNPTIEDVTQSMIADDYFTGSSFTEHILSAIAAVLFSISIFFILQGFYNLNKEK